MNPLQFAPALQNKKENHQRVLDFTKRWHEAHLMRQNYLILLLIILILYLLSQAFKLSIGFFICEEQNLFY